jgi:hypothetical protein
LEISCWISTAHCTASTTLAKLGDHSIAPGIHDAPVMALHQSCHGGAVAAQRPQRSRFVCFHEARISVHISAQDGGQSPFHLVGHRLYGSLTSR